MSLRRARSGPGLSANRSLARSLVWELFYVAALLAVHLLDRRGRIPPIPEHGNAYRFSTGQVPKRGEVGVYNTISRYAQQLSPSTNSCAILPGFPAGKPSVFGTIGTGLLRRSPRCRTIPPRATLMESY